MQAVEKVTAFKVHGDWLRAAETVRVINALHEVGATPRFVGGCVRDALVGRAVNDIDIAVDIMPEVTFDALEMADIKAIPTGIEHGTITAVTNRRSFEITTLRVDLHTDGRHADVRFTSDWVEDARRRDFTMNALYADPDGTVHDFLDCGIADATARRVRFIGNAQDRIREDYLRILRLFRFHAWYGTGDMEPDAVVATAGLAGGIATLSRERVGSEMMKLLAAPKPAVALETIAASGVLANVLPSADTKAPIRALEKLETRFGFSPSALRRLALLCRDADPALVSRALRLSNETFRGLRLRKPLAYLLDDAESARRVGFERGEDAGRDLMLLDAAWNGTAPDFSMLRMIGDGSGFKLPLNAGDLIGAGVEPGPEIGEKLETAEKLWVASDFTLDKSTLLAHVMQPD